MARISCLKGKSLGSLGLLLTELSLDLTDLPFGRTLPTVLPQPRFQLGETVRWVVVPEPDFGQVVGIFYAEGDHHQPAGIHYLVLLDAQSPSRHICDLDTAFEADLELWRLP